ncbi:MULTISPECIES: aKG-HExxH-type peptide beta-hydroxylase [Mycobacteriaceae]|jgi:HEXXH motif-containing protein|nr:MULTISPECIES: HEXXH motif-containing putative peptide modification protein [Mycobacteriaceae]MCV7251782.1 hypothetical protein [Mycobacterium hackensackense]
MLTEYRRELTRWFKIAGMTAISRQLVSHGDGQAIRSMLTEIHTHHGQLTNPMFEYASQVMRDAVTEERSVPDGFGNMIAAAAHPVPAGIVRIAPPEHHGTYKMILDQVIARQDDIETASIPSTLMSDTRAEENIRRCTEIINRHVPRDLVDLPSFANTIVAFDHPEVSGTSVSGATGLVFVRPEPRIVDTIDHIIHEWSHNKFELILHSYQLWTDDTRLHRSPIRDAPRPLYGVFHAIYVLLVVSDAMVHLMELDELRDGATHKVDSFLAECDASLRSLETEPSLTDDGRLFIDICLDWITTIAKDHAAS